jgi:Ser/Thr protein kinase RdoA (MazF antagonist)
MLSRLCRPVRAPKKPTEKQWIVYLIGGKRAQRLGTVAAPGSDAAIAKAIDTFEITDPARQKRVAVRPIAR